MFNVVIDIFGLIYTAFVFYLLSLSFSFLSFLLDSKISDGCNLQSLVTILREVEEDSMLPTPEPTRSQTGNE